MVVQLDSGFLCDESVRRFKWFADWRKKVDDASKGLKLGIPYDGEKADGASKSSKHDINLEGSGTFFFFLILHIKFNNFRNIFMA